MLKKKLFYKRLLFEKSSLLKNKYKTKKSLTWTDKTQLDFKQSFSIIIVSNY